jgi:3-hydroxyacyl-[acyl-carrier-protein] dehydratase
VLSYEKNKTLEAIKNVTANEPYSVGHFPARPVMPGVLIIEALAQAAGVLIVKSLDLPEDHKHIYFFAGIDNVRFKRVVEPGDQLKLHVEVLKVRRDLWKFLGTATVDGEVACTAEIMTIKGSEE